MCYIRGAEQLVQLEIMVATGSGKTVTTTFSDVLAWINVLFE